MLENAFRALGGVPAKVVFDNAKSAVTTADWHDPVLNPKIVEFCRYYGTAFLPTRPRTPRHKGKGERGVGYVQSNALRGRVFESLTVRNSHLQEWERRVIGAFDSSRSRARDSRSQLSYAVQFEEPTSHQRKRKALRYLNESTPRSAAAIE
jgi:transposase